MGNKYSVEFRKEAVALVQQEGRGVAQVAESLGISDSSLYRWVELYGEDAPEDTRRMEAKRIRELEREVRSLKEERNILKKAIRSFVLDT